MDILMPQMQLPIFPTDCVHITSELVFENNAGRITYFNGCMPLFSHEEHDLKTFRMITSQFYINGNATQAQIAEAFGVTLQSIKRSVKLYRTKGIDGFYAQKNTRGAAVLTESVLEKIQSYLDEGQSVSDIATELDLKKNTISKAIQSGRLHAVVKKKS